MKKFTVTVEEIVSGNFEIEAETAEEALKFAEEDYNSGDLVIRENANHPVFRQMAVSAPDGECTEWQEF